MKKSTCLSVFIKQWWKVLFSLLATIFILFHALSYLFCTLYLQNSVDFVFNKWSFFTLQEYGWFYALQSMPYVLWNINSVLGMTSLG